MRLRLVSPVLATAIVAGGLAIMTASTSHASPVKLYFRSAGGGYFQDWQADPAGTVDDAAPAGSTLDAKAPTKTTSSDAKSGFPARLAGAPFKPTFSLPFTGDVTSVCLDMWVKADVAVPVIAFGIITFFNTPSSRLILSTAEVPYAGGIVRATALVKPPAATGKFTIPAETEFMFDGYVNGNPDLTLVYDSVTHPSSITLNPVECKATPVVVPSATASATPSATATPSASATATPSASATATPSGSATATATPSVTPTAAPTTPPPPAKETTLEYTGVTAGRYSDLANVSARVGLPDGTPVPTGSVEFVLGGVATRFPVNSSGVAAGRMPVRAASGEQILTARYVANSAYLGAADQVPFVVSRMSTRCAISRTTSGGNYVITGTLRDAAGRAVAGQSLLFAYNNRTWKAVRTDRNGRASVTVAPKSGTHMVTLPSNAYYTGCSASVRV